jgi:hypothetical protein
VAEAACGHRTLEQRGGALVAGSTVDEVHSGERFERLWNKGDLSSNF